MSSALPRVASRGGFTLLEVMIALVIGTLIAGGVMGLISTSLQYRHRLQAKSQVQPVLEAAAQQILADPQEAQQGSLTLRDLPDSPTVDIALTQVPLPAGSLGNQLGAFCHVVLSYQASHLEFSLLIPESAVQ